jgi:hypothetical protein
MYFGTEKAVSLEEGNEEGPKNTSRKTGEGNGAPELRGFEQGVNLLAEVHGNRNHMMNYNMMIYKGKYEICLGLGTD